MGKKAALKGKDTNKKLTPAQEKKAARKAEIAAAKAQTELVKGASSFVPTADPRFATLSLGDGEELEMSHFAGEESVPLETLCGLLEDEELPAGFKGQVDGLQFVVARKKAGEAVQGFVAYGFGFQEEVPVLTVAWVGVGKEVRRKGLGTFLLEAMEATATACGMKGVVCSPPSSYPSTHPALTFLHKAGYTTDPIQPQGKATVAYVSKYHDEEAVTLLTKRAEALRKGEAKKTKLSSREFAEAHYAAGQFG